MGNDVMMFDFQGQPVRMVMLNGDPLWVAKDVCDVLDQPNISQVVARLDEDEKGLHTVDTLGGAQELVMVTEAGLYSLILTSRKPEAKAFKRWITHDVLPGIRKNGSYSVRPASALDALRQTVDALVQHEQEIARLKSEHQETKSEVQLLRFAVDAMGARAQDAEEELFALPAPVDSVPERTTRATVRLLVNTHCEATGLPQQTAYNALYRELRDRYSTDLKARVRGKKMTALEMAENLGLIEKVYALAYELFGPERRQV